MDTITHGKNLVLILTCIQMSDSDQPRDHHARHHTQTSSPSGFTPQLQTEAVRAMDMLLKVLLKKKDGAYRQQDEATFAIESISKGKCDDQDDYSMSDRKHS